MLNSTGYYKHILKCSEQMEDGRMILFDPDSGKKDNHGRICEGTAGGVV